MKKEELIGKLDQWIRRSRRDESAFNIIWHIDDESAYQEIVALIKKEVTEEWIQEKAMRIACKYMISEVTARKIIRSFVEEIQGRSK